jgi:hypothetical protein
MVNLILSADAVDTTWHYTTSAYWTTVEVNFSIICACVMTLKPLIVKLFPGFVEVRLSSSDRDQSWELSTSHNPPTIGTKSVRTPGRTQDTLASGLWSIDEETSVIGEAHQARGRNSHPGARREV